MSSWTSRIILILFLVFAVLQLIPADQPEFIEPNSNDLFAIEKTPNEFEILVKQVCYDCHSNQSNFPWYSKIAPVSWWIYDHIEHGKKHLNFSDWGKYSADKKEHKIEECIEMIEEEEMPLPSYQLAHSEARLSDEQKELLLNWFGDYINK